MGTRQQRSTARSTVQSLNTQAMFYKLQHQDMCADPAAYPNREPFTQYTDEAGAL